MYRSFFLCLNVDLSNFIGASMESFLFLSWSTVDMITSYQVNPFNQSEYNTTMTPINNNHILLSHICTTFTKKSDNGIGSSSSLLIIPEGSNNDNIKTTGGGSYSSELYLSSGNNNRERTMKALGVGTRMHLSSQVIHSQTPLDQEPVL